MTSQSSASSSVPAIPGAVSEQRLKAYANEARRLERLETHHSLRMKVRFIATDLELILADLDSPTFRDLDDRQRLALNASRQALRLAIKTLPGTLPDLFNHPNNDAKGTE